MHRGGLGLFGKDGYVHYPETAGAEAVEPRGTPGSRQGGVDGMLRRVRGIQRKVRVFHARGFFTDRYNRGVAEGPVPGVP